jgi:hypothetical protein
MVDDRIEMWINKLGRRRYPGSFLHVVDYKQRVRITERSELSIEMK